ncbi:MAG TPA: lamin tail domain-containing protein [Bacteroidales bacterium]|nr:lamin tail domain-containing protein [Bacteroidales bacterium]
MNKVFQIALLLCFFQIQVINAQNQTDIRINEVMTLNCNGPVDGFGHHSPWIEIFNSSYGTINIAGMYLTDDIHQPKKYRIPADSRMYMASRSYLLFYCNGFSQHGVFYTNFQLDSTSCIYIFASNAQTIIDSVSFNFTETDQILARDVDGDGKWVLSKAYTPNQSNVLIEPVKNAELFVKYDPLGIGMAIIAMSVVLSALALLYLLYKLISKLFKGDLKASVKKKKHVSAGQIQLQTQEESELSGEINAAIALALSLYNNQLHDREETVLTIQRVNKTYSPWSSKLYNQRQMPERHRK